MGKLQRISLSVLLLCAIAFMGNSPVSAVFLDDDLTQFTGDFGTWDLYAVVSKEGDLYCYEYTVTYTDPYFYMTRFSVDNQFSLPFSGATHDNAGVVSPIFFRSPTYNGSTLVSWSKNGNGMPGADGRQITFKYYSEYGYRTDVSAWMVGGASLTSSATTIGMAAPEPTSLMGLGLGLCGVIGACRRRFRSIPS